MGSCSSLNFTKKAHIKISPATQRFRAGDRRRDTDIKNQRCRRFPVPETTGRGSINWPISPMKDRKAAPASVAHSHSVKSICSTSNCYNACKYLR